MLFVRLHMLILALVLSLPMNMALSNEIISVKNIAPSDPSRVRRNYRNTSRFFQPSYAIFLEGSPKQILKISNWLDEIFLVPFGRQTIESIHDSGNQVTIRHSHWALMASGRTSAPISSNLTNGKGEGVIILFDSRIPDSGSHWVFDTFRNPIEFNAIQNLFHELAHAKHLSNGTWRYFNSEGQAIEEENIFRKQLGETTGKIDVAMRIGSKGEQIWWPE
ncbi:MAG: M91 family zinc metallopeptidase [Gammaproteobacteria bacterium]